MEPGIQRPEANQVEIWNFAYFVGQTSVCPDLLSGQFLETVDAQQQN
jgi:hypothetical protein